MSECNDNEVIIGMAPVSHSYPVNDYELPEGVVIVIMDDDSCPYLIDASDYVIGKIDE